RVDPAAHDLHGEFVLAKLVIPMTGDNVVDDVWVDRDDNIRAVCLGAKAANDIQRDALALKALGVVLRSGLSVSLGPGQVAPLGFALVLSLGPCLGVSLIEWGRLVRFSWSLLVDFLGGWRWGFLNLDPSDDRCRRAWSLSGRRIRCNEFRCRF